MKKVLTSAVIATTVATIFILVSKFNVHQTTKIDQPIASENQFSILKLKEELNFEEAKSTINVDEMKTHLSFLASDELEGRMSGKKGNETAADFIKNKFESFGLKTQLQKFNIQRMNPGPKNEIGKDYTCNIIGVLEGQTDEVIIVGAHMDHIGYGPQMSRAPSRREIHNGADDNASGSTVVIELAEAFSKMPKPKHTMVFICFSAEEMGLIGAKHYVKNPIFPLDKTSIMVNFDMVGYLFNKESIGAYGADNIPSIKDIINKIKSKYLFRVNMQESGGGSDHAVFGNANVPYVFFHTGLHAHYHTPDDDAHRIDYNGLGKVAKFAFEMIYEFDQTVDGRPVFFRTKELDETHDHDVKSFK